MSGRHNEYFSLSRTRIQLCVDHSERNNDDDDETHYFTFIPLIVVNDKNCANKNTGTCDDGASLIDKQ